jgi:DNA-directed RNA polymerase subunit beta'
VLEYFISTHGARKGLADTALRTADSGYLTRRLVDVAQDVIVRITDCGTSETTMITLADTAEIIGSEWPISRDHADAVELQAAFARRIEGRFLGQNIVLSGLTLEKNTEISDSAATLIAASWVDAISVRSPLSCEAEVGVCQHCYGRNVARGELIALGESVGIMAAQSIGEPGTQLTMRTFHTGGVAQTQYQAVVELDPKKLEVSYEPDDEGTFIFLKDDSSTNVVLFRADNKGVKSDGSVSVVMRNGTIASISKEQRKSYVLDKSGKYLKAGDEFRRANKEDEEQAKKLRSRLRALKRTPTEEEAKVLARYRPDVQRFKQRQRPLPVMIMRSLQTDEHGNRIPLRAGEKDEEVPKIIYRAVVKQLTGVGESSKSAGLPRVEELFEARRPKGKAEISRIDGVVEVVRSEAGTVVEVTHREVYEVELDLPIDASITAREGDLVEAGQLIGTSATQGDLTAPVKGMLVKSKDGLVIRAEDVVPASKYPIPHNAKLLVKSGDKVRAGDPLTDGPLDPQELLEVRGRAEVQNYLVKEVQKVYRSQGVTISDKHIEIIVRQLLRKVRVDNPGDTRLLPTELADRLEFERENARVLAEGGEPATAQPQLLGVTKASLNTESFLAAASFQETTRVLTEAAITGAQDRLVGLKENVIIGKLIPAGTGAPDAVAKRKAEEKLRAAAALAGGELPADFGQDDFNVFLQTEEAAGPQDDVSQLVALLTEEKPAPEEEFNPLAADAAAAKEADGGSKE